jgi:predicted RNA-binding protein associated with RNAse of E/G family
MLLRSVYGTSVRRALAHRFIGDGAGRLAFYCSPGNRGKWIKRDSNGRYLERWVRGDPPVDLVWTGTHAVRLVCPEEAHTVELYWDLSWQFRGWYVNLQAPIRRSHLGYDATDWALDIRVRPDGSWEWKDEDDFAEAQLLGVLNDEAAMAVRHEGERVLLLQPWPTGWENWRPQPDWTMPLPLPERWDEV